MTTLITTFLLWIFFWSNLCFTVFFILVLLPKEEGGGKESFATRYLIAIALVLSLLFSYLISLL